MNAVCSARLSRRRNPAFWRRLCWRLAAPSARQWRSRWSSGNQPRLTSDLLSGIRTLTSGIVIEMGYAEGLHREALIAAGIVLFVFILLINASFSVLKRREQQ